MKTRYSLLLTFLFLCAAQQAMACHALPLFGLSVSSTSTHFEIDAYSDPSSCGCGPYYIQAEVAFAPSMFTQQAPAPASPLWNNFPWYLQTLDITNPESCVLEPYRTIQIPYSALCPGTTYYVRVREYVSGSNVSGPWSGLINFTTPGVTPPPSTTFTASVTASTNVFCGASSPVTLTGSISGACNAGSITYSWAPAASVTPLPNSALVAIATPTTTTTYTFTCYSSITNTTVTATTTITVAGSPTVAVTGTIPSTCNGSNGSFTVASAGGTPPYSYTAYNGQLNQTFTPPFSTLPPWYYLITATDSLGCTDTMITLLGDSCDFVWPGDANDDGTADNFDILTIGIANGTTGTARPSASLSWIGQPSPNWPTATPSGTNHKFVDCDGNALIDLTDTNAVLLNYGFIHNNRLAAPVNSLNNPDLYITVLQDTLMATATGVLQVNLGSQSLPVNSVYGIAFTLNFDPQLIDENSLMMTVGNSFFGVNANERFGIKYLRSGYGQIDVAVTRINQTEVSGMGQVCSFSFTTNLALPSNINSFVAPFSLSRVRLIDLQENTINLNTINDTLVILNPSLSIQQNTTGNSSFEIIPNPSNGIFALNITTSATDNYSLSIYNAAGQLVWAEQLTAFSGRARFDADLSVFGSGLYMVRLSGSDTETHQRLMIW
jgi:hypothetical protein